MATDITDQVSSTDLTDPVITDQASSTDLADPVNKLSLHSYINSCPPGWDPAVAHRYPLRRYLQLLRLWSHQTDMGTTKKGPAICSRLRGAAFQYAMQLSQMRLNMTTGALERNTAPELFAEAAYDEWIHHQYGTVFPAMDSGTSFLIESLKQVPQYREGSAGVL